MNRRARDCAMLLAFFAGIIMQIAPAWGAPRRVAVVNAATDQIAGSEAASKVRNSLDERSQLAPLSPGAFARALEGPLPPDADVTDRMPRIERQLRRAIRQFEHFRNRPARIALERTELELLKQPPSKDVHRMLAELNFYRGLLAMRQNRRADAMAAFSLVRRLDPDRRELSPARYKPSVVRAFAEAGQAAAATSELSISTSYDGVAVYIDGHVVGAAPLSVTLPAGRHYVFVKSRRYAAPGNLLELQPEKKRLLTLSLNRRKPEAQAELIRRRLLASSNPKRWQRAARHTAELTATDAVVLLRGRDRIEAAVFDANSGKLSYWRPVDERLGGLLSLLTPVRTATVRRDPAPDSPITRVEKARPWYRTPAGIAGIVGGSVIVTVVGVLLLTQSSSESGPRTGVWNP